jgi:PIN domain nuclease of toxin-antitoxin system
VRMAECSAAVAIDAGMIPRTALADLLDRLLVSIARQSAATLLTADAQILEYAARRRDVRVHDARL